MNEPTCAIEGPKVSDSPVYYERPPRAPAHQYQLVTIEKAINGFVVEIGCMTFVKENWIDVSLGLAEYWADPAKAERMFCKGGR